MMIVFLSAPCRVLQNDCISGLVPSCEQLLMKSTIFRVRIVCFPLYQINVVSVLSVAEVQKNYLRAQKLRFPTKMPFLLDKRRLILLHKIRGAYRHCVRSKVVAGQEFTLWHNYLVQETVKVRRYI